MRSRLNFTLIFTSCLLPFLAFAKVDSGDLTFKMEAFLYGKECRHSYGGKCLMPGGGVYEPEITVVLKKDPSVPDEGNWTWVGVKTREYSWEQYKAYQTVTVKRGIWDGRVRYSIHVAVKNDSGEVIIPGIFASYWEDESQINNISTMGEVKEITEDLFLLKIFSRIGPPHFPES